MEHTLSGINDYQLTLVKLYYLIAIADGTISEAENEIAQEISLIEQIDFDKFQSILSELITKKNSREEIVRDCIEELEKLQKKQKEQAIAWMGIIADHDKQSDSHEWLDISEMYIEVLDLDIKNVLTEQKNLSAKLTSVD